MPRLILFILLFCVCLTTQAEVAISASEVYEQVLLIEKETELVQRHFNSSKQAVVATAVNFEAQPRHVWQKGYMLQMELVAFRRKHHLDGIAPVGIEPREDMDSRYTWGQAQRILTEIRIIRKVLGIHGEAGNPPHIENKTSLDVFNKLAQIEAAWDAMTEVNLDSAYPFAQALRLNGDVDTILRQLGVFNNAIPPAKHAAIASANSLEQAFLVLKQVQRLQKLAGLETVDLSAFRKTENVIPSDVFNMVCLILAELQPIKDKVGLEHTITPVATYQKGKKPADTWQLLGYISNKLALIEDLSHIERVHLHGS